MQDTDLIGEWFRLVEKAFGVRMEFELGRVTENASEPEWFRFLHSHHDGIGAFLTILERQGMVINGYPRLNKSRYPGWMDQVLLGVRSAWMNRKLSLRYDAYPWRVCHEDAGDVPCGVAWFILAPDEVASLRKFAGENRASLTTFLLWTLSRSVSPVLLRDPTSPLLWRVPVNLRGPYLLEDVRANHVGSLYVEVPTDVTLETLHRRIQRLFKRNLHWAGILRLRKAKIKALTVEEFSTKSRRSRFSGLGRFSGRYSTGTFSNIGEWPGSYAHDVSDSINDTLAWLFVPPFGVGRPIGAGCVSWNGRLGLTVSFAPSLVPVPQDTRRLACTWLREILGWLSSVKDLKGLDDPESRVHFNAQSILMNGIRILPKGSPDEYRLSF